MCFPRRRCGCRGRFTAAEAMDASQLNWLSACDAARAIRDGAISSEQLVAACLARIREAEPQVEAWQFLDPDHALAQARARDLRRGSSRVQHRAILGRHVGGVDDVLDADGYPVQCTGGMALATVQIARARLRERKIARTHIST